jgi:hypothetical protein
MPNDQVRYSCDKQPVRHSLGTNLRSIILTEMLRESFSTPHARMVCMSHGRRPLLQWPFFKKFSTRQDRRSRRFRVLYPSLTLRVGIGSGVETRRPGAGLVAMSLLKSRETADDPPEADRSAAINRPRFLDPALCGD